MNTKREIGKQFPVEVKEKLLVNLREDEWGGKPVVLDVKRVDQLFAIGIPFGIKWECKRCGNCCIMTEADVFEKDIECIKRVTGRDDFYIKDSDSPTGYRMKHIDGKCIFLNKQRRCEIYNIRPFICKIFPFFPKIQHKDGLPVAVVALEYPETTKGKLYCNGIGPGTMKRKYLEKACKLWIENQQHSKLPKGFSVE
jgi:Fe-S-cluster containining protein